MAKIATAQQRVKVTQLDPTVRALGVVSLLNDLSSEVAVRTLPLFLANVLGVRTSIIGLIEGIGESTATLLKLVSGHLSDRIGKKKSLVLWGYSLSNLTKPLLYFATSWTVVLLVRFLDRVGKGIRTAPRDALIADVTTPENRGHAFGFNKAMDKTGGFIGVLLAAGLLYLTQRDTVALTWESYRWLVLLAVSRTCCRCNRGKMGRGARYSSRENVFSSSPVRDGRPILGIYRNHNSFHPGQF
jgi:MFS family permease